MSCKVEYSGGQSRSGDKAVDYMMVLVDGVELYAEADPVDGLETETYDGLKESILEQAAAAGIDPNCLAFW